MNGYNNGIASVPQQTYGNMTASGNRKKKFAIVTILNEKGPANVLTVLSEDHDTACHQAEVSFGYGTFIAFNKKQAQKVYKNLKSHLQNW